MEATAICILCNSLGSNDVNFLPNTGVSQKDHARIHYSQSKILNDGITEDESFQRCFTIRQPKVVRLVQKSNRVLVALCKSLLNHQTKSPAACNVCGSGICLRKGNTYNMVRHACAHLEVKVFQCRHCEHSLSSSISIQGHIRRVHKIQPTNDDIEDKTVQYFDKIYNQIHRCFSANNPRSSGLQRQFVNCRDKSQRSAAHFCRSIFIQRSKPTSLECNLCGTCIRFKQGHGFAAKIMFQHAAAHLDVKLFACRHCNQSMSSKGVMKRHLKDRHHIVDGSDDDFEDRSEKFHSEYLKIIKRCFSDGQVKLKVPTTKSKPNIMAEATIHSHTTGSKLNVERRLFCYRLVRNAIDRDGKIKCSLCKKRLSIKRSSGRTASQAACAHAEMHLRKPLYRCIVCEIRFNTYPAIAQHLRTKHALGLEKNQECIADEFHEEIMSMLSKCYAASD